MSTMTASKTPIARFLYANGLSKKEVAGFGNDRGWDTTTLTNPAEDDTETLRAQLRAKDEQIAELLRIIDKLTPGKP